jgi:type IV fimbrial biogenesis protein FimT
MITNNYGRCFIELVCVILILSLTTTIALPSLQDMLKKSMRTKAINQMTALIHHTRSNAVFSSTTVSLCSGEENCLSKPWESTMLIFIDRNADGHLDSDDSLLHQAKIIDDFSWRWNRAKGYIQFDADGTTRALNGTLTLCHKGVPEHQIVIALAGRIRGQTPAKTAKC